jgi:hypothetical protein
LVLLTLFSAEEGLTSAVIDSIGQYAYFGTDSSPGHVVKIDLSNFTYVKTLTLDAEDEFLISAVIDPLGQYAYFGTNTSPGRIVKIDLTTFTRVDVNLTFGSILSAFRSSDVLYFGGIYGEVIRLPAFPGYLISGLSGNVPGNLINNTIIPDIDYKSQIIKLKRNQQSKTPYYYSLKVTGITGETPSSNPVSIHAQIKVFPQ